VVETPLTLYRGQTSDQKLSATLERDCLDAGISRKDYPLVERQLIRAFRRRYDGPDRNYVLSDTLYCMSLMQHHGAPTRLLDTTYSPYVSLYFALKNKRNQTDGHAVIWCFNHDWFNREMREINKKESQNTVDTLTPEGLKKSEDEYYKFYCSQGTYKFVGALDSFFIHTRINLQQGAFICSSDITSTMDENFKSMKDWRSADAILKVEISFSEKERWVALDRLRTMNIAEDILFPGLDGFCGSLKHRLKYLVSVEKYANAPPPDSLWGR
jgi:hypothetical protein